MLERLAEFSKNKGAVRQFAIRQAADMLIAAGVQFPESRQSILPEGAIRIPVSDKTAGKDNRGLERLLDSTKGLDVSSWARDIIRRIPTSEEPQEIDELMAFDASTMGLSENPTTKQAWKRGLELGDKVPAKKAIDMAIDAAEGKIKVEIGKPLVAIMDPIADSRGDPRVFGLGRYGDGLWLDAYYARPEYRWYSGVQFVVSPRK